MSKSVLITDFIAAGDALEPERKILGDVASVQTIDAHTNEELIGRIEDADAIILYHLISMTAPLIERLRHCKLIVRAGVGYDNVDCAAARARGIQVANIPDYGTEEVADSALGLLLALTRGVNLLNSRMRAQRGPWMYHLAKPLHRLRGRVLGIVGLGRIGTAMALRGKALGMDVLFYDPYKPDGFDKALGVRRAESLGQLLGQSFAVSLHCPLTAETRGFIDAAAIARMPRGSYLINTARGAVVNTAAIPDAIASGQLAGAGLDVLEIEPPPANDPLMRAWRDPEHPAHEKVIVTPHAAFYCEEGLMEIRVKSAEACRRALLGQTLRNVVNE
ncbi:MAG TPA: C-terminal binding protein [Planctomycetota bacterium]